MGIYDREYYRHQRPSSSLAGPRTVVVGLILVNALVYVADWILSRGRLTELGAATVETLTHPLDWWQFLTYGFLHAYKPEHIVLNMLGLFFLGRDVEDVYGPREFLRIYLALLVFGSVVWAAVEKLQGAPPRTAVVGASGAVAGIVVLYAMNFPRRQLALFFVIPVPAWLAGVIVVFFDALGAMSRSSNDRTAYVVHLAGAALAFLYFKLGWNFGRLFPNPKYLAMRWFKPRPKPQLYVPEEGSTIARRSSLEKDLAEEVDRILEKISREGEAGLTRQERHTLELASRQYQKRRQGTNDKIR